MPTLKVPIITLQVELNQLQHSYLLAKCCA